MKTQPWDIFERVRTTKCIASCNHDGSLENDYYVPFFKLKFLIHTLRHIFCSSRTSNIYGESDFRFAKYVGKKYIFVVSREFFQKKVLSSSAVDIIFHRTFLH